MNQFSIKSNGLQVLSLLVIVQLVVGARKLPSRGSPAAVVLQADDESAAGQTQQGQAAVKHQQNFTSKVVDCDALSTLAPVAGHDLAQVASTICKFWPSRFGSFPVQDVETFSTIITPIFDEGGLWDQLGAMLQSEEREGDFCLRSQALREHKNSDATSCPATVDAMVRLELTTSGNEEVTKTFEKGEWACADGTVPEDCSCTQRDDVSTESFTVARFGRRPDGCKMVHQGKCYGDCPYGHKPHWLLGGFRPVCTAICHASTHPFACGVGCAGSRASCREVIAEQVSEIALTVGLTASFALAAPLINTATQALVAVTKFILQTLSKVIQAARTLLEMSREKMEVALLVVLFQYCKEQAQQLGGDVNEIITMVGDLTRIFTEIYDSQLAWQVVNPKWLSNIFLKHGVEIVHQAFKLVEAFTWKKCGVAGKDTVFSIEAAGSEVMIGSWLEKGTKDNRPRYESSRDKNVILEFDSGAKAWGLWWKDTSGGVGKWFGWVGLGWQKLYESRREDMEFPPLNWKSVKGQDPAPVLLSEADDGVAITDGN